jgi:hypothetical protein
VADRYTPIREALTSRTEEARLYRGSDAYRAFIQMLIAVDACYSEDLRADPSDRTAKIRGASAQCRALIDSLSDQRGEESPKI